MMEKCCLALQAPNLIEEKLIVMISEINIVGGSERLWVDTYTSRHVCYDHALFKTYSGAENKNVLLSDSYSTKVVGTNEVELKLTFHYKKNRI